MNRRTLLGFFVILPLSGFAAVQSAYSEIVTENLADLFDEIVTVEPFEPWWNGRWYPACKYSLNGPPGTNFALRFYWRHNGIRRVVKIGRRIFVDGRELDQASDEYEDIESVAHDAWIIALEHYISRRMA